MTKLEKAGGCQGFLCNTQLHSLMQKVLALLSK